jgi:hypothetical protein
MYQLDLVSCATSSKFRLFQVKTKNNVSHFAIKTGVNSNWLIVITEIITEKVQLLTFLHASDVSQSQNFFKITTNPIARKFCIDVNMLIQLC